MKAKIGSFVLSYLSNKLPETRGPFDNVVLIM